MESRAATDSDSTWSTLSRPARIVMISELGLVYFLVKTPPKNVVKVCPRSSQHVFLTGNETVLTSRALMLVGASADLASRTARAKSCCVCNWDKLLSGHLVRFEKDRSRHTCKWSASSGLRSYKIWCSLPHSGGRRKNSLQNPSVGSEYSDVYITVNFKLSHKQHYADCA